MKRTLTTLAAALALAAAPTAAQAQFVAPVQYQTFFSFDNTTFLSTTSATFGSMILTFNGQPITTVEGEVRTNADFGTVIASGGSSVPQTVTGNIFMQIVQTVPSTGNAVVRGTMSGSIRFGSSQAIIDWNSPTNVATIGDVTYWVEQYFDGSGTGTTPINPPSFTSPGTQTIRGSVLATPEPASMALLATGLLGIVGGAAVRRRRGKSA